MMNDDVKHDVLFNAYDTGNFENFVHDARSKLRSDKTPFIKFDGVEYLIVKLDVPPESLYLYIRRSDIYLVALRVLGDRKGWYEFKPSSTEKKKFPKATLLPFEAGYGKIIGYRKVNQNDNGEGKKKDTLTDIKLVKHEFSIVVWDLIHKIKSPTDIDSWCGNILKIILFVSEAIRFDQIVKFIKRHEPDPIPKRETDIMNFVNWLVTSWEKVSASASRYDQQPGGKIPEATTAEEKNMVQGILSPGQKYRDFLLKPKLCAIILGDGIRCRYLNEDKERKKHKLEVNKKTENRSDSKKKRKTGSSN